MKRFVLIAVMLFAITAISYPQSTTVDIRTGYGYSMDTNVQFNSTVLGKDKNKFFVKDVYTTFTSNMYGDFSGSASLNYAEATGISLYTAQVNYGVKVAKGLWTNFSLGKLENPYYHYSNSKNKYPEINYSPSRVFGILPVTDNGLEAGAFFSKGMVLVGLGNVSSDTTKSFTGVVALNLTKWSEVSGVYFKNGDYQVYGGGATFSFTKKRLGSIRLGGEFLFTDNKVVKSQAISLNMEVLPVFLNSVSVVGRYDNYKMDTNLDSKYEWVMVGLEYTSLSNATVGLNFRTMKFTGSEAHNELVGNVRFLF